MADGPISTVASEDAPPAAGAFVEALVTQDFGRLHGALAPQAKLRALLPAGLREWSGADAVADRFAGWFGDTELCEPVETAVGVVGGRTHLRWRLRVRAARLGDGAFVVEQAAYADVDDSGRIDQLDLVCTGYLPEAPMVLALGPDHLPR